MRKLLLLLAAFALAPAWAQEDEAERAQRARIAAERQQAEAAYQVDEKACYGKFAVNDCLDDARRRRRAVLADLRRQEVSLSDAQRKRRAAEKLRSIEERSQDPQHPGTVDHRAKAAEGQRARDERAAQKAADRASAEVSRPARAAGREEQARRHQAEASAARAQRDKDAARNVELQKKRLADAQARREKLQKRLAEHRKPDAKPLPATP